MKILMHISFWIFLSIVLANFNKDEQHPKKSVITGADRLLSDQFKIIKNKSVGIVTNHTGLLSNGTHLVDTLFNRDDVEIKALFGPEHGIRGDAPDGNTIKDGVDTKTGIPVYSLYGKIRKPTPEMLNGIDILIFDIQDIGARFYTFISTMYYVIQAGAENGIPVVILDRPNPIGGLDVEGPICSEDLFSFVGIAPIPIRHGMTVGELAAFFNSEGLFGNDLKADLNIVKMKNWQRNFYYDDCGLTWIKPSPNMPNLQTAIVYPGMCLIEGTNVSEGRGSYNPFLWIGAPYIDRDQLYDKITSYSLPGTKISAISYVPVSIPNMSTSPKYKDENCNGISIEVTNRDEFKPVEFSIYLIKSLKELYPEEFEFKDSRIDRLFGQTYLRKMINDNSSPESIIVKWQDDVENFKQKRNKYLLY